jgi:hypothetical protein
MVPMKPNVAMNLRLSPQEYAALKARARSEGLPLARVIREALRRYIAGTGAVRRTAKGAPDPLLEVIGMVDSGLADGSVEHDHYIYGTPRRKRRGPR